MARSNIKSMENIYNLFLVLHFIGLAGLLGGLLAQIPNKPKQLQKMVMHSALLMFIAGVVMVLSLIHI